MAKTGLHFAKFAHQLKAFSAREGWALCVGAGTSLPLFPTWNELVRRLLESESKVRDETANNVLLQALTSKFEPDTLIEAARDRLGLEPPEFAIRLGEALYKDFMGELGSHWGRAARVLSAACPGDLRKHQWVDFLEKLRSYNANLLALNNSPLNAICLAEAIMDSVELGAAPAAIISFNAEPLLYSLINAVAAERHDPITPDAIDRARVVDRVTRLLSYRELNRIPYFSCHGLLPFPSASDRFLKEIDSGKLVFSEGEYLALANSSFAWQSSIFLSTSVFRHMVFVGVSLADPNMRRWLAWVHATRTKELKEFGAHGPSASHYWINKRPNSKDEAVWIESCVGHLGVRLVWLDEWKDLKECLDLALS